jgi:formiminotetrahydrofolate cyclodeaminase
MRIESEIAPCRFASLPFAEFTEALASKAPVPGGVGAAAFAGALGAALGGMVGSLTVGKKKYEAVEGEMRAILDRADHLRGELQGLADQDAEAFMPLTRAWALPQGTEEEKRKKEQIMEECLEAACTVPLEIMKRSGEMVTLLRELAEKGTPLAKSDAGVGLALCRGAIQGAALNVLINTKALANRSRAGEINRRVEALLEGPGKEAEEAYSVIWREIRGNG